MVVSGKKLLLPSFIRYSFTPKGTGEAVDNIDDYLYHYTDEAGARAIGETGVIRPDNRGRVFVTTDKIAPQDANNMLFMGTKGDDAGIFRIEIELFDPNDYKLTIDGATQPNELIYKGAIRDGKNAKFKIKENDFR